MKGRHFAMEGKENMKDPKGGAAGASKAAGGGRRQSGGGTSAATGAATSEGSSMNQGGSGATAAQTAGGTQGATGNQTNQGATGNQGTTGHQSTTGNQGAMGNQGGQQQGDKDLLQQAKQTTGEIVSQVQQRASSQLTQQKDTAASELTNVANAVRQLRHTLEGEQSGPIARYVADYGDKAAEQIERLGAYLREQDPRRLLDDVQNFGRRQPALLLGGAFLLGLAGARLIKSSMEAAGSHQGYSPNARNYPRGNTSNVGMARPTTTPNAL
jgi:hypothetical protein